MTAPADPCWLDHGEFVPGYRKVITGLEGRQWEIILCPEDAMTLEAGFWEGDYSGAELPPDSRAPEWPWRALAEAG